MQSKILTLRLYFLELLILHLQGRFSLNRLAAFVGYAFLAGLSAQMRILGFDFLFTALVTWLCILDIVTEAPSSFVSIAHAGSNSGLHLWICRNKGSNRCDVSYVASWEFAHSKVPFLAKLLHRILVLKNRRIRMLATFFPGEVLQIWKRLLPFCLFNSDLRFSLLPTFCIWCFGNQGMLFLEIMQRLPTICLRTRELPC